MMIAAGRWSWHDLALRTPSYGRQHPNGGTSNNGGRCHHGSSGYNNSSSSNNNCGFMSLPPVREFSSVISIIIHD